MKKVFILVLLLSLGINGWLVYFLTSRPSPTTYHSDATSDNYPYLSSRIFTNNQNDILINFIALRAQLRNYVLSQTDNHTRLYFEYLPSGVSIGINDTVESRLVSLAKVPTVMAIYRTISEGKLKKDTQLTIKPQDLDRAAGSAWQKGVGAHMSVQEAINLTLTDSDNTTHDMLLRALPRSDLDRVYNSLDIPLHTEENHPVISPKNYSSILRSLYLSSYLPLADSEEILTILTKTNFKDKLPAGVPDSIPVAHKIGINTDVDKGTAIYSDCGIIYPPKRPYILCLMDDGDEQQARTHMRDVSRMVYGYVNNAKIDLRQSSELRLSLKPQQ